MPVETRYMRSDQHTVNGLTALVLGLTNTATYSRFADSGSDSPRVYWGIRVWKREADGTETEVTAGTPVAVVSRTSGSGVQSATWDCPQTALNSDDAVVVRVYSRVGSGAWNARATFITEQLGASQLDSATWTVYYYTGYTYNPRWNMFSADFSWGSDDYPSRIEGFSYTPAAPPPVARRFYGDGLTLIAT